MQTKTVPLLIQPVHGCQRVIFFLQAGNIIFLSLTIIFKTIHVAVDPIQITLILCHFSRCINRNSCSR